MRKFTVKCSSATTDSSNMKVKLTKGLKFQLESLVDQCLENYEEDYEYGELSFQDMKDICYEHVETYIDYIVEEDDYEDVLTPDMYNNYVNSESFRKRLLMACKKYTSRILYDAL